MNKKTVFIISGPLGVGKTSVSKKLASTVGHCVMVEGDVFFLALENDKKITWEQRLQRSWDQILRTTEDYVHKGFNVVIDFVVEEELAWFSSQISEWDVQLRYVVLYSNEDVLTRRLQERGDMKYLPRSLVLLRKLMTARRNEKFLYDTSEKSVSEIAQDIQDDSRFIISLSEKDV